MLFAQKFAEFLIRVLHSELNRLLSKDNSLYNSELWYLPRHSKLKVLQAEYYIYRFIDIKEVVLLKRVYLQQNNLYLR